MKIRLVAGREIDAGLAERWTELQASDPRLASPYLCPEFTRAAAATRAGVEVAVLERDGSVVGFLPFQREPMGVGKPVGGRLSDCQALIAEPGTEWSAPDLLRACRLSIWDFDHLLAFQEPFRPFHRRVSDSPILDLSRGFEAWVAERRASGSNRIPQTRRKTRKLEREHGPLRFEPEVSDPDVLDRVIAWKSEQCRRTGVSDFFALDWTVDLVRRIHRTRTGDFAGVLSALWVGDRLAAAHMGMRSRRTCHWWFPVYEHDLARYSPGSVLLLELARWSAEQGLDTLELGKGDDAYKQGMLSGNVPVAEGCVTRPSVVALGRRVRRTAEALVRRSGLAPRVRFLLRWSRRTGS